jgi:hypothetical protein
MRRIWKPKNLPSNRKCAGKVDHSLEYVQETVAALQVADMANAYSSHAYANKCEVLLCVDRESTNGYPGFIHIDMDAGQ